MSTQLDSYSLLIVSKYLKTSDDYKALPLICKKFNETLLKFRYNPISNIKLFPLIETQHLYDEKDEMSLSVNNYVFHYSLHAIETINITESNPNKNIKFLNVDFSKRDYKIFGNNIINGVSRINDWAFHNCVELTSLTIPSTVTDFAKYCFFGCFNIKNLFIDQKQYKPIVRYEIAQLIESGGCKCLNIGYSEQDRKELNYKIPERVKYIFKSCFADCVELKEIKIPNSVILVDDFSFANCSRLQSITIPSSVTFIGKGCFKSCSSLKEIRLERIISIGYHCFYQCSSLTSVTMADSVVVLGRRCFSSCHSLSTIKISRNVNKIPYGSFNDCVSLKQVILPPHLFSIGRFAFKNCVSLNQINIPTCLTSIKESAFEQCVSLLFIELPKELKILQPKCFWNCSLLKSLHFHKTVTVIPERSFENCFSLTSLKLPKQLQSIQLKAFNNCSNLTNIVVPSKSFDCEFMCFGKVPVDTSKFSFHLTKSCYLDNPIRQTKSCNIV